MSDALRDRDGRPVRLIAFYLPQFHPIPENDAWWGKGFTEWANVVRATSLFDGHLQPRRPADLGFYDLRVPEVREQQAALARGHGIHGFCYYYYWFGGRRLLGRPLDEMLASGRPDFPFCICWANENWTRRWDGDERDVLIAQDHSAESDLRFILDVIPILRDPRYIHYDGKPLLLVYRANILPDPLGTTETWRATCRAQGLPEIHLVAAQTFGLVDPLPLGFDAAVEFPPHGIVGTRRLEQQVTGLHPEFHGKVHDYRDAVACSLARPPQPYRLHRSVMVSWDNTPRRRTGAHVWHHATPDEYEGWLRAVIEQASRDPGEPDPLVFINAWNEWAEGAYLEPDDVWGHAYLLATRRALMAGSALPARARPPLAVDSLPAGELAERVRALERELEAYRRANEFLRAELETYEGTRRTSVTAFVPDPPPWMPRGELPVAGWMSMGDVGPRDARGRLALGRGRRLWMDGWAVSEGIDPAGKDGASCLLLLDRSGAPRYYAPLRERQPRPDVVQHFAALGVEAPPSSGIAASVWYGGVEPGAYRLGIVQAEGERVAVAIAELEIEIPDDEE